MKRFLSVALATLLFFLPGLSWSGDFPYVAPDQAYLWAPPPREGQTPVAPSFQLSADGQTWTTISIEPGTAQNFTAPLAFRSYDGAPVYKLEPGRRYGVRYNPGPADGRGGWWEPAPLEERR